MSLHEKLKSIYEELLPDNTSGITHLFVVPLIRFNYKQSDYLYLLYKGFIEDPESPFKIHSTSILHHFKFVWYALRKRDVLLHYHWLECTDLKSLSGMIYKLICIALFKAFGGKLVWTVHNIMPHDRQYRSLNYKIRSYMAHKADLLHVHCETAVQEVSSFYGLSEGKFRVIPHPEFPAESISRKKAIKKLNKKRGFDLKKEDQIFLMFGNISAYKKILETAQIFTALPRHKKLLIAGPVKKGQLNVYHELKKVASKNSNILLYPHFISEESVPLYHNVADCVLFNYREILTSGGVALARSYNRPIIAPKLGCLKEVQGEDIFLFDSQEELRQLLTEFEPKEHLNA